MWNAGQDTLIVLKSADRRRPCVHNKQVTSHEGNFTSSANTETSQYHTKVCTARCLVTGLQRAAVVLYIAYWSSSQACSSCDCAAPSLTDSCLHAKIRLILWLPKDVIILCTETAAGGLVFWIGITSAHARFGQVVIQHTQNIQQCRTQLSMLHVRFANVPLSYAAWRPEAAAPCCICYLHAFDKSCQVAWQHAASSFTRRHSRLCMLLSTMQWQLSVKKIMC